MAPFFFNFLQFFTIFFEKKRKKTKTLSEKLGPENCMGEKFSLRERRGAAHLQRGRTEGRAGGRALDEEGFGLRGGRAST